MALTTLTDFLRPETVADVSKLLVEHGDSAMIMGGGTFIHGLVARGLVTDVQKLIDLSGLGLNKLEFGRKGAQLGATATYADLERSGEIQSSAELRAILDATAYPPQQIKNAATVGGCIAGACPYLDMPIVLLALNATATIAGTRGSRDVPLEELFVSLFQTSLASDEFITGFKIPKASKATASAFEKLETTANDLSIVSAAVSISKGWRKSKGNRIFIGGGIGEVPFRCSNAEDVLSNSNFEDEALVKAGHAAADEIEPFSDHRASAAYRKKMTGVLVTKNLRLATSRLS